MRATHLSVFSYRSVSQVPADVRERSMTLLRLIGKPAQRLDLADKTNGRAVFGIDVIVPGMHVALIAQPPLFGSKPRSVDSTQTLAITGVRNIIAIDAGVAVVRHRFLSATKGRDALE